MKTVTVVVPTYNEELNVQYAYDRITEVFEDLKNQYNLEILFIDNASKDSTRKIIINLANRDPNVKAIFNAKNFGFARSTYYGLSQAQGDCAILLFCDMQDPPENIPLFLEKWEQGYKIVAGIKNKSQENKLVYFIRSAYYKFIKKVGEVEHIEQFTGFGLYDHSFIKVIRGLNDSVPYLRGIVAELGYNRYDLCYEQDRRKFGKSSFNFLKLYDVAMLGITSYSKVVMRIATIFGFMAAIISLLIGLYTLVLKLTNWVYFDIGTASIIIGIFIMGSLQLFFIGLLGEYILNINMRVMNRPLVIEEKRINFDKDKL